ncbi:MAG: outer membrane beta-barrel protein [Bdellovibrionales bacterium]|nr:outer membrane beta-barrel protein [Massilia sp.]
MKNSSRTIRGSFSARAPRALPLAALLAFSAGASAFAAPDPAPPGPLGSMHPYVALGYVHDDNLFRLATEQPAFDNQRADSARYAIGGFLFDKRYGRQKVYLQAKLSKVKFSHFTQLDYQGKDFLGLLNWQLGNHIEGSAGASYEQTLAPYIDFRSSERNLRVHKNQHADAAWRMHPSWQLRAGAARDQYSYALSAQRVNNRTEDMLEAGFDFLPSTGSTAGLVLRRIAGSYDVPRIVGGALLNDDFTQDELKARMHWKVTGMSSVQVLAGYARRRHAVLGRRNASGLNGRVSTSLSPRQKLRLNAAAWREFAPVESELVTYSLNRGVSVGGSWDASAKVRVDAALSQERRRYQRSLAGAAGPEVRDRLTQASLSSTWSLRPKMQLVASYAHQRRSGATYLGNGSFKSNTVSVSATIQF